MSAQTVTNVTILTFSGTAQISRRAGVWDPAHKGEPLLEGDRMRTGRNSRATIRLSDGTTMTIGAEASFEVPKAQEHGLLSRLVGWFYFFHRDKPGSFGLQGRTVAAAVRGTEFELQAAQNGTWVLSVLEGDVFLHTPQGDLDLHTGHAGLVKPGAKPEPVVMRRAKDLIQWCLYYPAVLDVDELILTRREKAALQAAINAYRVGDLSTALAACPFGRRPGSDMEAVFRAQLLLAVGEVERAEGLLDHLSLNGAHTPRVRSLAMAVRELIAVVKAEPSAWPPSYGPPTASEWLAKAYRLQSKSKLVQALAAARRAVAISPDFGFGWERVAELEFSFGRVGAARQALAKALKLSPRNAQARTLQGFLFAADNRLSDALRSFNEAIAIDGRQGNAWLGRGLCRIRRGDIQDGSKDLIVAASLEPRRAELRGYLGKAFALSDQAARAHKEFDRAEELDPHDPTPWLYSALLLLQENRINEAVAALEKSIALNDNRSPFRSRLLLDQDRAVRGANLAAIYQEDGMNEVAVREATKAVEDDYANYSAHLFLANSYNALRDPQQVNLRYDTATFSEYLLANLLAPVGAGALSPAISQQEYSPLFEQDGLGLASVASYSSYGDWVHSGAQYGRFQDSSYAIEDTYRSQTGYRPNDDQQQLTLSLRIKQQLTPHDSVYLQPIYYHSEGGDLAPEYDPSMANRTLRVKETQEPLLLAGYHHEWRPGVHTILLAGRIQDSLHQTNAATGGPDTYFFSANGGKVQSVSLAAYDQLYHNDQRSYVSAIQQVFEAGAHTLVLGGRYQAGDFKTESDLANGFLITTNAGGGWQTGMGAGPPRLTQTLSADFERYGVYGYDQWRVFDPLLLIGGIAYDHISYPKNFQFAPLSNGEESRSLVGPKAGLVWTPTPRTTLRAGYSRTLGGISIAQNFRLEPSQIAGFNQAFRSVVPEAVAGQVAAPKLDVYGFQLEQDFPTRTYLGITAGLLESKADRAVGGVQFAFLGRNPYQESSTRQSMKYDEETLSVTINQLLGDDFALGVTYRVSRARLKTGFPDLPPLTVYAPLVLNQDQNATLHQVRLYGLFNHPSGFFCEAEAVWNKQLSHGYAPALPGDDFWQFNLYAGYRWWHRRAELRLGLLNLTDQDYHLNPLNLTVELPHDRTLTASLSLFF